MNHHKDQIRGLLSLIWSLAGEDNVSMCDMPHALPTQFEEGGELSCDCFYCGWWDSSKETNPEQAGGLKHCTILHKIQKIVPPVEPHVPKSHCGWTLREYDSFDHTWIDIASSSSEAEIVALWNERTNNGTEKVEYDDGVYYAIFPADTRMVYRTGG